MTTTDFTTAITVTQTPQEVFAAVNSPQKWWTGDFEGETKKLYDEFTYRYKEFHYSKQRVVELVPNEKVVWLVTESALNFIEDTSEWTGTEIIFEISAKDGKTELRFTHRGLAPEVECFAACSGAWTQLIGQGLCSLIAKGKTDPVFLG